MINQKLDSLANQALQSAAKEVVSMVENDPEIIQRGRLLKQQAKDFLKTIPPGLLGDKAKTALAARVARLQQVMQKSNNEESVIDAVKEVHDSVVDEAQEAAYVTAKLLFQQQLNDFLGQEIVTVYVYSNAKAKKVTLVKIDSRFALKKDLLRQTMRYTNMSYINSQREESEKFFSQEKNESQAKPLQETYFEVLARGRKAKRRIRKDVKLKNALIVFWKHQDKWETMRVSSEGDINEAYANFYLNKKYRQFKKDMEKNINNYMLNKKHGVIAVSNVSGLLEGDVNIRNIAYAIKSRGATMFGDSDIIATAQALVNMSPDQITKNALLDLKKNFQTNNSKQQVSRQKLNEVLSKEVDGVITDLIKQIKKDSSIQVNKNWAVLTK